jgi:hypothetical protein
MRSWTAFQSFSGTMRVSGVSAVRHSLCGRGRATRRFVPGTFTKRERFHTSRPAYRSLRSISRTAVGHHPAAVRPLRGRGAGMRSALSVLVIVRSDFPAAESAKMRRTTRASALSTTNRTPASVFSFE